MELALLDELPLLELDELRLLLLELDELRLLALEDDDASGSQQTVRISPS
jgi:hypothetical protein